VGAGRTALTPLVRGLLEREVPSSGRRKALSVHVHIAKPSETKNRMTPYYLIYRGNPVIALPMVCAGRRELRHECALCMLHRYAASAPRLVSRSALGASDAHTFGPRTPTLFGRCFRLAFALRPCAHPGESLETTRPTAWCCYTHSLGSTHTNRSQPALSVGGSVAGTTPTDVLPRGARAPPTAGGG
jgi:hypothetical protein